MVQERHVRKTAQQRPVDRNAQQHRTHGRGRWDPPPEQTEHADPEEHDRRDHQQTYRATLEVHRLTLRSIVLKQEQCSKQARRDRQADENGDIA